jgi:hypothetical protein
MYFVLGLFACPILLGQEIRSQSGSSVPKEVTAWFQSAATVDITVSSKS